MKIYIVFNDAQDGIELIDKVFDTQRKAYDYVIKKHYSGDFYKKMIPAWLDDNASGHVEEREVE